MSVMDSVGFAWLSARSAVAWESVRYPQVRKTFHFTGRKNGSGKRYASYMHEGRAKFYHGNGEVGA